MYTSKADVKYEMKVPDRILVVGKFDNPHCSCIVCLIMLI